jgi:hypothetical protein
LNEHRTGVLAASLILLVIVSVPVFSTVLPPLLDYPNHLARMHLIVEGGNPFYAVRWAPLPDLAADLVIPALTHLVPLEIAGKLFLVITFALLAGGTLWLNRVASGCWRWWGLLGFLLLYDRILLWGFLNYLFGLGIALCGIALWLMLEDAPRWRRIAASSLVVLACFFSHIAALGVYALALAGIELMPALRRLRAGDTSGLAARLATAGVQFVVPAILFLFCQPASPHGVLSFTAPWRKPDLLFSVFDNYNRPFDVACFVLFVALFGVLAWRRRLRLDPRLGLGAGVVLVAYLLLPSQMLSGSGVDRRLPLAFFLLLIASTAPRALPRRAALTIGLAVAVIFAARMAVIEKVWLDASSIYAADIAAIDTLPEGAKLAVAYPDRETNAGGIPELHVATLAAMRREAFVPTLFAYASQQPIALRPPYDALAGATSPNWIWGGFVEGNATEHAASAAVLKDYDYVVFASRDPFTVPANACLVPMQSPPRFRLFKLRQAETC